MKNFIYILGISLFMGAGPDMAAQDFMPDSIFMSQNDSTLFWFEDGTAFCTFNGMTYAFVWTREKNKDITPDYRWYPYVYTSKDGDLQPFVVEGSSKLQFGYQYEDDYGYQYGFRLKVTIVGNAYAFSYAGYLWFNCVIEHPPNPNYYPGTYHDLWARYDPNTKHWDTWFTTIEGEPDKYYIGACQVDSLLHRIYYDTNIPGLGDDLFTINSVSKKIDYKENFIYTMPGNRFGGMFAYRDTCGYTNYIYNTYMEKAMSILVQKKGTGGLFWWSLPPVQGLGASCMVRGSAQGMRMDESFNKLMTNRFNVFTIGSVKKSDGSYPLFDWEWVIPDQCMSIPTLARMTEVSLPVTCTPLTVDDHFNVAVSANMIPTDFSTQVGGVDGLLKQIQVFYPGNDKHVYGAFFNSDIWRPVKGSSIRSTDLANDEIYGPQIRKLWTLVGITDGAPPCSIDWETWNTLKPWIEPTELNFTVEEVSTSKVTSTYKDSYTLGTKIEAGYEKRVGIELGFEWTNSFISTTSSSNTITTQINTPFGLNESSQEYAYYIWNIPQITRTSYEVYPWYDTNCLLPVASSFQFQFRTIGTVIWTENIEASEFPFLVHEPNDPLLEDFSLDQRWIMEESANNYDISPLSVTWTAPNKGQSINFKEVSRTTSSVESENSYTWEEGDFVAKPHIFKVSTNMEAEISYSSGYEYETEFGEEVEISLTPLTETKYGNKFSSYEVDAYWFRPNQGNWWYLDSLEGQKPWYLGYITQVYYANRVQLLQLSPEAESLHRNSDILFAWQARNGELNDYTLFITEYRNAGPGSTVCKRSCGNKSTATLGDFKPEPGKTYYWAIRGITPEGHSVWSDFRAFMTGDEQDDLPAVPLKATVYPNPAPDGQVCVAYDLPDEGSVSVCIYDINGQLMQRTDRAGAPAGITSEMLTTGGYAPGIYIVVISTENARAVKKLVIK